MVVELLIALEELSRQKAGGSLGFLQPSPQIPHLDQRLVSVLGILVSLGEDRQVIQG